MSFDIDAYCRRIGYGGPREATLEVLRAVNAAHPQAIAFDSLDPWLGRPVSIAPADVARKLVAERRGGYCYEHNTLLWLALAALGFRVSGLNARVTYSTPPGGGRHPRNHMLLLIALGADNYIADVGFGGLTLTAPLKLVTGVEQRTPHETVRLGRADTGHAGPETTLEVEAGGVWRALYQFGSEETIAADYEVANYYMSRHERSPFTQRLVAARALPGRRLALSNRQFTTHHVGGDSVRRELQSPAEIRAVLTGEFGVALPDDERLEPRLASLFA